MSDQPQLLATSCTRHYLERECSRSGSRRLGTSWPSQQLLRASQQMGALPWLFLMWSEFGHWPWRLQPVLGRKLELTRGLDCASRHDDANSSVPNAVLEVYGA